MALLLCQNISVEPNIGVWAQQICLIKSAAKFVNEYDSCPLPWRDFESHNINPPFRFSGRKKAAECNLDGSFPAFYIYNNGKQRFFTKQSNNQNFKNATGGKP